MRISAAIITLNEERNIGRCLDSLRGVADEVVVVDSGSSDGTERICRERGAVFVHQPFLGYGPQKNFAAERVTHEWLLSLDADEALSPELAASISALRARGPGADAYEVNRLNWYCGRFLHHAGMYPDRKVRLWRRGMARWSDDAVHELASVAPGARQERLAGDLLHYTCLTREQHLGTIERFTTLNAEKLLQQGKTSSAWRRLASPAARFLRMYVLQLGFLDGRAGFDVSRLTAYSVWLKYEKLRRLQRESTDARPDSPPVVHVSSARTWRGGEQQVLYLVEGLERLGVPQRMVCPRGSALEEACRARDLPCVAVPRRASVDPLFARGVARACAELGAKVLHAHDPHAHSAAVLSSALFGNKTPTVVHRRVEFPIGRDPFTRWKYDHRSVKRIVCVSRAIARVLTPVVRDPDRLRVVHSCVDPARFAGARSGAFRRELGVPDRVPLVGNVSALSASKDHLTWLEVAALLTAQGVDARYVIVGEGEERARIEARIAERGLRDRVFLAGFRRDVPVVMADLDLFLFTSRVEGLGTTLLDAFAAGVPVVATRAGGIPEVVRDGETGFLAEPGDAPALADRARRVLADAALRGRLVAAGRAEAADHAPDAMVRRMVELYAELADPPGAATA